MFEWWNSLSTISLLSTGGRWLIALMGIIVLIIGARQSALQKKADEGKQAEIDQKIHETQQETLEQRKEVDRLKKTTAPREISKQQKTIIMNALAKLPGIHNAVVASYMMDSECGDYGGQISSLLSAAGWKADLRKTFLEDSKGITAVCITAKGQVLPGYEKLITAFKSAGIVITPANVRKGSVGGDLIEGTILIMVGRK